MGAFTPRPQHHVRDLSEKFFLGTIKYSGSTILEVGIRRLESGEKSWRVLYSTVLA